MSGVNKKKGGYTLWNYNYSQSDELYHYGVLGMKWGVHKLRSKLGPSSSELNRRSKQSGKAYETSAKKSYRADKAYSSAKEKYRKVKKNGGDVAKSKAELKSALKEKRAAQKEFNRASNKYQRDSSRASKRNRDDLTWNTVEENSPVKKISKLSKEEKKKAAKYTVAAYSGLAVTAFVSSGAAKKAGRAACEAIVRARGGTNITWLD